MPTRGEVERALRDFNTATDMDPKHPIGYAGLAFIHTMLGDDEAARKEADRAIAAGYDSAAMREAIEGFKELR